MMSVGHETATGTREHRDGTATRSVGRNDRCPCGSGSKYKKCCLLRERRETACPLPSWLINSSRKLHQFEKYATKVFGLPRLLGSFGDERRGQPTYSTFEVANSLVQGASTPSRAT